MTIAFNPPFSFTKSTVSWFRKAIRSQSTLPAGVWSRIARSPMPSCLRVVVLSDRPGGSSAGDKGFVVM